jgi:hypothetical protein
VNGVSGSSPHGGLLARLPAWVRPLPRERPGTGSLRLVESAILVLVGVLLAIATVNDVVLQTHVNHRLIADLHTWRVATGRSYHNLSVEQDIKRHTTRERVCGNLSPGGPDARTQLCLSISGRTIAGLRQVDGGYYLPAKVDDVRANRYGCFGEPRREQLCGMASPPAGAPPVAAVKLGRP